MIMPSVKLLLGLFLHRSAVQGHMPWMTLLDDKMAVDLFFGEGPIPDPELITSLDSVHELDLVHFAGTSEKFPVHLTDDGRLHGDLPEEAAGSAWPGYDFQRPATAAGFLDYGEFGEGARLHYSFTTQAYSKDHSYAVADWAIFFSNFDWVDELFGNSEHEHNPLFVTMKNFGGPPYELAVNGIPGMTSIQGCLYQVGENGENEEMGCTETELKDYDGNSFIIKIDTVEEKELCAGEVYYFRARTRDNYDSKEKVNISSYATGSVKWDATGKECKKAYVRSS